MKANQTRDLKATIVDFIGSQQCVRVCVKGFSRLNHQQSLFFFKNKKRKTHLKNVRNSAGGHNPGNFGFPMIELPFGETKTCSKICKKPIHQSWVGIANGNIGRKVNSGSIDFVSLTDSTRFSFHNSFITDGDRSFSINNSSKISKLNDGIFHKLEAYHKHNNKVHRERLNPATP